VCDSKTTNFLWIFPHFHEDSNALTNVYLAVFWLFPRQLNNH
jgi:hypothetical protein